MKRELLLLELPEGVQVWERPNGIFAIEGAKRWDAEEAAAKCNMEIFKIENTRKGWVYLSR